MLVQESDLSGGGGWIRTNEACRRQIYSLLVLATHPPRLLLAMHITQPESGFEPLPCRLQVGCATVAPLGHSFNFRGHMSVLYVVQYDLDQIKLSPLSIVVNTVFLSRHTSTGAIASLLWVSLPQNTVLGISRFTL